MININRYCWSGDTRGACQKQGDDNEPTLAGDYPLYVSSYKKMLFQDWTLFMGMVGVVGI